MKRRGILIGGTALFWTSCAAPKASQFPAKQNAEMILPDWMYPDGKTHYLKRIAEIEALDPIERGVLLIGDSITEGWLWQDFPYDGPVANHGISWDTSAGVLARKRQYFRENPAVIFILIGTNDLSYPRPVDEIDRNIQAIVNSAHAQWPKAKIYLQTLMPRDGRFEADVGPLNARIRAFAERKASDHQSLIGLIDLEKEFSSEPGVFDPEMTYDALHLNDAGYRKWGEILQPYLPR